MEQLKERMQVLFKDVKMPQYVPKNSYFVYSPPGYGKTTWIQAFIDQHGSEYESVDVYTTENNFEEYMFFNKANNKVNVIDMNAFSTDSAERHVNIDFSKFCREKSHLIIFDEPNLNRINLQQIIDLFRMPRLLNADVILADKDTHMYTKSIIRNATVFIYLKDKYTPLTHSMRSNSPLPDWLLKKSSWSAIGYTKA